MVGMLGPVMSASRSPTRAPCPDSARARFTATVDLPTPPLLEATAMMFFTPFTGWGPTPRVACTSALMSTVTPFTPGTPATASSAHFWSSPRMGQAGVVRTNLKVT